MPLAGISNLLPGGLTDASKNKEGGISAHHSAFLGPLNKPSSAPFDEELLAALATLSFAGKDQPQPTPTLPQTKPIDSVLTVGVELLSTTPQAIAAVSAETAEPAGRQTLRQSGVTLADLTDDAPPTPSPTVSPATDVLRAHRTPENPGPTVNTQSTPSMALAATDIPAATIANVVPATATVTNGPASRTARIATSPSDFPVDTVSETNANLKPNAKLQLSESRAVIETLNNPALSRESQTPAADVAVDPLDAADAADAADAEGADAPQPEAQTQTVGVDINAAGIPLSATTVVETGFSVDGVVSNPLDIAEQIAGESVKHAEVVKHQGQQRFTMRLDPPELGEVIVEMERTEHGLSLRVNAVNPATLGLIQASIEELNVNFGNQDSVFQEVNIDVTTGDGFERSPREESFTSTRKPATVEAVSDVSEQSHDISFVA